MDTYALYKFSFKEINSIQGDFTVSQVVEKPDPSVDKNPLFDHLFGERKTDVRIQRVKKNMCADKYPCTVLAHKDRVIWLRLENEKAVSIFVKQHRLEEIDPIDRREKASYPYSFIFIDCREGKNMLAIKKEPAAWRKPDTIALLLQESLNAMMESLCYAFRIQIIPETLPRDFFQYNHNLIKKEHKRVRKMTIKFKSGTIDPEVEAKIRRTPILSRLLKEMWRAPSGELILHNPEGMRIVDKRLVDVKKLIELILCLGPHSGFGLSLSYDDGVEISCGEEVHLSYGMENNTLKMLFDQNLGEDLFGEYEINKWLDRAANFVKSMKNEETTGTKRQRKTPGHVQETSLALDFA